MVSPQCENGYTRIANEILEALARIRIPGEARQVFDTILRKTYGFGKKEDGISLSQFVLSTSLLKNHICDSINKLKKMNLITQKDNDIASVYSINKDYTSWKPLPKKVTLPKKVITITEKGNESLPKKVHTIDKNKETITKEIVLPSIISQESWDKWIEHKKKQKKPMTPYAKELAISKLTKLHKEGHLPKDVVENSIENNYQGLFPGYKKQVQKNEFGY